MVVLKFCVLFCFFFFPRRTTRWLRSTVATDPWRVVTPRYEMVPVEEMIWSQYFDRKNEDILSVTSTTADCFTSGAWECSFLFSTSGIRLFVFWPWHLVWQTVTRRTRACVNTLLWSKSVFLHQPSSFLTEVVFDIESCMQKAHWYCEWITVHVINSFIFYFHSVFDLLMYVGTKIHFNARCTVFFLCSHLVWLPYVQYFSIFTQFAGFVFCFFGTCIHSQWSSEFKPAERNKIWTEYFYECISSSSST